MEDHTCPVCAKPFASMKSLNSHLRMAKSCSHWGKGKRKELAMDLFEDEAGDLDILDHNQSSLNQSPIPEDENPMDVMQDWNDEHRQAFYFVEDVTEGKAGPGPSSTSARQHRFTNQTLDDDEDARVEDSDLTAGAIIRMDEHLHQRWKALFGNNSEVEDEDIRMDDGNQPSINPYAPFASELEWRVARWAVKDGIGHKSLDRLLAISGVRWFFLELHLN